MVERTDTSVSNYIWNSITEDQVLPLEDCFERLQAIPNVPKAIRNYLFRMNQSIEQFELLLHRQPFMFFVENGRFARYDPSYHSARKRAVDYFRGILDDYDEPAPYMGLRGHVGQADEDVLHFINTFYPGETFIMFFVSYPDNFVVFQDDTVQSVEGDLEENDGEVEEENASDLENDGDVEEENDGDAEEESVRYFEGVLGNYGYGPEFMNLRGHLGQASSVVINYINDNYPKKSFLNFLNKHNDVFEVRGRGVFLR